MEKIHAWIYNPDNAMFKGQSKKAALFELYCDNPDQCSLLKNHNSCLLQEAFSGCKFGRKSKKEGFTRRARNYYDWISKARKDNEQYFKKLETGNSYGGISKIQDHYHLPYSYMSGSDGYGFPISSSWVSAEEMTVELLEKICEAKPRYIFEHKTISKYQDETVPRFVHDLKTHHQELFKMLPEKYQGSIESINFVGRKADIKTCAAGRYKIGTDYWDWDGEKIIGGKMLFQPVEGEIKIEITPKDRQPVKITDNSQVTADTVFLD